ncbi:acyltransferase [Rubrivivax sp. JA1024]|nr:acyltransferase [Rubrivivax sp. JA1024]
MGQPDERLLAPAPGGADHVDYLDGWRGLSILGVLQGHFLWLPGLDGGSFGVSMFFVLSGLLMANILFVKRQPLPVFYRRRASRILPAFVLFVAVVFAASWTWGQRFTAAEFWSTLFFLRTYYPASGIWGTGMPIGHLWSLNVEEHCYLLMSLLALVPLLRGREGLWLLAIGFGCIATGFVYVRIGAAAPRWGALGTEVAGAALFVSAGYRLSCDGLRRHVPPWLPVVTLLTAFVLAQRGPWWSQALLPLLLAFSVNHLGESGAWFQRLLSARLLRRLGLWSFSLYLWQQPFFQLKSTLPGGALAGLGAACCVALLSFYLVEKPARDWLNRRWRSDRAR